MVSIMQSEEAIPNLPEERRFTLDVIRVQSPGTSDDCRGEVRKETEKEEGGGGGSSGEAVTRREKKRKKHRRRISSGEEQ
jgi:hypothetical protein